MPKQMSRKTHFEFGNPVFVLSIVFGFFDKVSFLSCIKMKSVSLHGSINQSITNQLIIMESLCGQGLFLGEGRGL